MADEAQEQGEQPTEAQDTGSFRKLVEKEITVDEYVSDLETRSRELRDPPAQPVVVDGHSRRSGNHPTLGSFVNVVDGEHKGRYGAYVDTSQRDLTGYPTVVFVRTRDADNLLLEVPYEYVRPSGRNGGR
jgi:hypothetical protein